MKAPLISPNIKTWMQSVAEEQVNMSIWQCHVVHVDHEVTNWDKVASFVDSEMKVPACISLFRQMHLLPTLLITYSSPSLVCWL